MSTELSSPIGSSNTWTELRLRIMAFGRRNSDDNFRTGQKMDRNDSISCQLLNSPRESCNGIWVTNRPGFVSCARRPRLHETRFAECDVYSRTTSFASLSVRSPRNTGSRNEFLGFGDLEFDPGTSELFVRA